MNITSISVVNFLSHKSTTLDLDGRRFVALVGANGAGKSSLLDAVSYALFDAARARSDDLVQLGATDMSATLEFAFASERYRVTRGRTTRSGGKSFLELAIADGDGWRPLTGETIRETQQRIEELLRLDAATFATAVLLAQGEADRFASATPADRKRVLGTVLGLDRYERASVLARERARELEAALAAERARLERIIDAGAAFVDADQRLAEAEEELRKNGTLTALAMQKRDEAEARLRELAGSLATVDAAEADVRRIETELAGHKDRWRRASDAKATAEAAITRATTALEGAQDVETAVGMLPEARARVEALEAAEEAYGAAQRSLTDAEARLREVGEAHAATVREHEAMRTRKADLVAALEGQIAGLQPVTCPECGTRFQADPAGLAKHLGSARAELAGIGAPPEEPIRIHRERTQVTRRRLTLEQTAFDPAALAGARRDLLALERTAARAGEIEATRAAIEDGRAHLKTAREEMAAIETAGKAASGAVTAAKAKVAEGAPLRARQHDTETELTVIGAGLAALDEERRSLTEAKARAAADLEQRDRLVAERDEVAEAIAKGEIEQSRWRKVATALGPSGIPARIIEGTVPELTGHINDVLGRLRPGMSLDIRTQRAKKAGDGVIEALDLVVRSDTGERPFATYSGGERMSLNVAIGVGLSRLVARRAGTAIRTLMLDEPEGLDAPSRRALGQALKVLAHHGDLERIVVVTHTPDLAEYGDAIYQVSRNGSGSTVELVA